VFYPLTTNQKQGAPLRILSSTGGIIATCRFRTRHVIREGRRLPAGHADHL